MKSLHPKHYSQIKIYKSLVLQSHIVKKDRIVIAIKI